MIERELLGTRIVVGGGALSGVGEHLVASATAHVRTIAIITDDNVAGLPLARVVVDSLRRAAPAARLLRRQIPAGESQKTRGQWSALSDWLLSEECGRDTTVVALGGGVVGDLAGFVAATFMRGVPVVQIPTTLVAMVDAAVGGKTGVDTPAGKNLIGAFHRPAVVMVDPSVLETLPGEHVRAGLAEVLKHGAIADVTYFQSAAQQGAALASRPHATSGAWWRSAEGRDLVLRSIEIKSAIVASDERESGPRESLNFGHTVAHALEVESNFTMLHGHAVAIGMIAEAALGERIGHSVQGLAETLRRAIDRVGLPNRLLASFDVDRLIEAMRMDKKARAGEIRFAIPRELGVMTPIDGRWSIAAPPSAIRDALQSITPIELPSAANR